MKSISANLNIMIKASEKASKILIRDFGEVEKLQVSVKGPSDFVSNADLKAEKIIIEELKKSCRKYLAGYKQPANILVIKEKDIPRSTTGKVQRHLVEKMLKPVFNLEMLN